MLGEFVLPHGGSAWTQTIVELLDQLGIREKTARQALSRMQQRGWLERSKTGRHVRWSLTETSRRLLEPGARRIYDFGQRPQPWDERWVVLLAPVPDAERALRYRLSTGLGWAGFGSLGQGLWVSPWPEHERHAVLLLQSLGVEGIAFRATLGELGTPRELAARAWDLADLRSRYDSFLTGASTGRAKSDPRAAAVALTTLVHRWRRFPFLDPDLPDELLPPHWPARAAARRFATQRAALRPLAFTWWAGVESRA